MMLILLFLWLYFDVVCLRTQGHRDVLLCSFYSIGLTLCLWFLFLMFLFFPFIFISWKLVTLQYCSGFCHTLTWISHGFTCVPHPNPPSHLPPHPIPWVFPVHQPWALVSCIQPGLVICFTLNNMHVLILFSHNIPPSSSPTESQSRFCSCVSFSVLHIGLFLPSF